MLLNEDLTIIEGMISREGEQVPFKHPISNQKVIDWTLTEKKCVSLVELLIEAVIKFNSFYIHHKLVVVAVQIIWTHSVDKAHSTIELGDHRAILLITSCFGCFGWYCTYIYTFNST